MAGGIAFRGHRHSPSLALPTQEQGKTLAVRARALLEARRRRTFATGLERAVTRAERTPSGTSAALPIDRVEVLRARSLLLRLAERLRGGEAVDAGGVAMVGHLLTDAASPIFAPGWRTAQLAPGTLEREARAALDALDARGGDLPAGNPAAGVA